MHHRAFSGTVQTARHAYVPFIPGQRLDTAAIAHL